jgi:5-methylcytosine-specific restriction endonuclease McrA
MHDVWLIGDGDDIEHHLLEDELREDVMEHIVEKCQCDGKYCGGCKVTLCIGKFHRNKNTKDKLNYQCKECVSKSHKSWYQRNHESVKTKTARWQKEHPEQAAKSKKKYKVTHSQQVKAQDKIWRDRNTMQPRQWRTSNVVRVRETARLWRRNNRDRHLSIMRGVRHRRRAQMNQSGGSFTWREWVAIKAKYNYTCLCCGRCEPEIKLTADHIVPIYRGGSSNIENIQPLCRSCNASKGTKIIDYRKL